MAKYICKKRCFRGGKAYKVGEAYVGDTSKPIPPEFVDSKSLTTAKKALSEPGTFFALQKSNKQDNLSEEEIEARRSLGHKTQSAAFARDAEDPFGDINKGKEDKSDDDFLS